MTIEEKKKQLIASIDTLSENELNELLKIISKFKTEKKEYIDEETFQRLLKETSEEYKEVWKKLA